jgi:hypothetical protein
VYGSTCEHPPVSFGPDVYERIRPGTQRSAAAVVPVVQRIVRARSVVDVGGGEGWWAAEFARLGVRAVCVDDGAAGVLADRVEHVRLDLGAGVPANLGAFDLALCLEVAEHLEAEAGNRLVATLCELAPAILFGAAVPGQGGHGHVNEQWPSYWVQRFQAHRFSCSGAMRWMLWNRADVEYWYRQNVLFATRQPELYPELFDTPLAEPWDVVHPDTLERAIASG